MCDTHHKTEKPLYAKCLKCDTEHSFILKMKGKTVPCRNCKASIKLKFTKEEWDRAEAAKREKASLKSQRADEATFAGLDISEVKGVYTHLTTSLFKNGAEKGEACADVSNSTANYSDYTATYIAFARKLLNVVNVLMCWVWRFLLVSWVTSVLSCVGCLLDGKGVGYALLALITGLTGSTMSALVTALLLFSLGGLCFIVVALDTQVTLLEEISD